MLACLFEPAEEEIPQLLVTTMKLAPHAGEHAFDFGVGQGHDPGNNPECPLRIGKLKRPEHNARIVRLENYVGAS
jgi:hypothetical protein